MTDEERLSGRGAAASRVRRGLAVFRGRLRSGGRGFVLPLSILLSGVIFQRLAALAPLWTEQFYTRPVYPRLVAALSVLSGRFAFSVGEVVALVTLLAACASGIVFIVKLIRGRGGRGRLVSAWIRYAAWTGAALLWLFLIAFGLNYQRPLLYDRLGYEQRRPDAYELWSVARLAVEGVNRAYDEAHAVGRPAHETGEVVKLVQESFDMATELALPRGDFAPPKPLFSSDLLTRLGISGIYSPFTGEPNYNADIPDFQLPFAVAHEMAHQRGVARESEANFVAYVVCTNSRDPFVRYSGYRNGLGVLSELSRVEPEKARELSRQLGRGYREDSRRAAHFWAKASGRAGALSYRLNDLYLRANRVKSGAADYSNSTTLIIAYQLRRMSAEGGPSAP